MVLLMLLIILLLCPMLLIILLLCPAFPLPRQIFHVAACRNEKKHPETHYPQTPTTNNKSRSAMWTCTVWCLGCVSFMYMKTVMLNTTATQPERQTSHNKKKRLECREAPTIHTKISNAKHKCKR